LRIIREVAGTQLDPKMVGAFLATQARLATQRKNGSGG
jgi:response regulator RpfG family c-di-GMP phosphodiesterase